MKIPIYKAKIEDDERLGIYAMSFVDSPANEESFVALSQKQNEIHLAKNEMKQILTGVILKPNQLIFRLDENENPYYITFSEEEVEKISQRMMYTGLGLWNTTHQHQLELDENFLCEVWIVTDPSNDKSNALGFKNLPKGTLMASYKISDKDYWENEVMSGNVKGFSLEGFFNQELQMNKIIKKINKSNMKKTKKNSFSKYFRFNFNIEDVEKVDETDSGETVRIYQLVDGSEFIVDEEGYATIDGEMMPQGEHKLSDGSIAVIGEDGKLIEVKPLEVSTDEPSEIIAPQVDEFETEEEKATITIEGVEYNLPKPVVDYIHSLEDTKKEVEEEVTELKKVTPSTRPINVKANTQKPNRPLKKWELMAENIKLHNKNR